MPELNSETSTYGIERALELRELLTRRFIAQYGTRVQAGPFEGMILPEETSWFDGDMVSKLLGVYEAALQDVLRSILSRSYDSCFNIGCAEGYYAVGLARRSESIQVHAFDCDAAARRVCAAAATLNGVSKRVAVHDRCTRGLLNRLLQSHSLLVVDCEGAEAELLDPAAVPGLISADLIVECHDFLDRSITPRLKRAFALTHQIRRIDESRLTPPLHPFLSSRSAAQQSLLLNEFRPEPMHWLVCTRRASRPDR
jgi:hypothetical protein